MTRAAPIPASIQPGNNPAGSRDRAEEIKPWDDERFSDEVRYAFRVGLVHARLIHEARTRSAAPTWPDLRGLQVLELGPGKTYGSLLVLRALGASIAVVDKFPAAWDPSYHAAFYREFLELGVAAAPNADWSPLCEILARGDHHGSHGVEVETCDLGDGAPNGFAPDRFDAIVSLAVLEHVLDVPALAKELARITRPAGVGVHQVDFRDHAGFDRPLEFLTVWDDARYMRNLAAEMRMNSGNGNRMRPTEMAECFEAAGFAVDRFEPSTLADPAYVRSVRPRLAPRFMALSDEELRVIGGRFFLRKPRPERNLPPPTVVFGALPNAVEMRVDEDDPRFGSEAVQALRVGLVHARLIARALGRAWDVRPDLNGIRLLELAPGRHVGSLLVCRALGARGATADASPAAWDASFHPRFYRALARLARLTLPDVDWSIFDAVLNHKRDRGDAIGVAAAVASDRDDRFVAFKDGTFDACLSLAVLEHVTDVPALARVLARVTRVGGVGLHQVDFRDHRDFQRPLEFLTLPEDPPEPIDPSGLTRRRWMTGSNGNRLRVGEMAACFRDAGFALEGCDVHLRATPDQAAAVRARLAPRFAAMADEEWAILGARLTLRRVE